MNTYIYIITDRNRNCLHIGSSTDLIKTIDFYTEMPNLFFDSAQQLNRLVYFEEISNEELAMDRFKVVSRFTRAQKEKMIRSVNPDWVDLTIGLKFETNMMQRTYTRSSVQQQRRRLIF